LILCKEFIDKHLCKIWVESVVNKGTTFLFTLYKAND
jgi:signal transduction histidine kinase